MSDAPRLGKYRLLKLLATGGMGEVFLARQEGPAGFAKTVVVKRMLPHLGRDPYFVQMFLNEARLAAALSHPNIVQLFELGEENGTYFIAMEFIHGMNLRIIKRRLVERQMEVPIDFAAWSCAQALKGLHYAHTLTDETGASLHVVHRDVSPDNVLVGFNGTVKMVDFGIAKASTFATITGVGMIKGKYAYMAPEQLSAQKVDARTDVYGMGVVLYELLAGGRPFMGNSEAALVRAILHDAPRPLCDVRPDIPAELAEIAHRAIAKEPQERFQTAESMAMALESFALGSTGISQEKIQTLLRDLFGKEAEITSSVSCLPTPSMGGPPIVATPPEMELLDLQKTATMQCVREDVAEALPSVFMPSRVAASTPVPPPEPVATAQPTLPSTRGSRLTRSWLWVGVGMALLLVVGVGVGLLMSAPRSSVPPEPRAAAELLPSTPPPPAAVSVTAAPVPADPAPSTKVRDRAPTRRAARAPEKPSTGTVALRVNPWAEVFHAGKSLGLTPMAPIELPSGTQILTLVNQDLEVEKKIRVEVLARQEVMLRINLLDGL